MCNIHYLFEESDNWLRKLLKPVIQPLFAWKQIFIYKVFIVLSNHSKKPIIGKFVKFLGNFVARYYMGTVVPMDEVLKLIESGNNFVVANCACREIAGRHPEKCCIYFGKAANVWEKLSNLGAERISKKRAVEIVKRKHQENCIHTIWSCTSKDIYGICNCCRCCCLALKFHLDCGITKVLHAPPFAAETLHEIEGYEKECSACEACIKVCDEFFGARKLENGKIVIDKSKCMACGRCIEICPHTTIKTFREPTVEYSDYKYSKK